MVNTPSPHTYSIHVHTVADSDVRDTSADFLDDACRVEAEDGGVFLNEDIKCLDLPLERVESGGMDLDENLARTGLLNVTLLHSERALGLEEVEGLLSRHARCGGGLRRED